MFRSIPRAYVNIKVRSNVGLNNLLFRNVMDSGLFRSFSYLSRNRNGSFGSYSRINIKKCGLLVNNVHKRNFTEVCN
jgi:hypothetical protein